MACPKPPSLNLKLEPKELDGSEANDALLGELAAFAAEVELRAGAGATVPCR